MGKEPSVKIMAVTPALARAWLGKNRDNNRNVSQSRVKQYAADIAAKNWRLSDQAISFDVNGDLVNGQHRLEAVLLAGEPIVSVVMRNLPTEAMLVLDSGKKRSTDEAFHVAGRDYPRQAGGTVRRIFMGLRSYAGRSFTDQEVDEFLGRHADAVSFAHRVLAKGKFATASLRAPLARARLRREPAERLERFAEVLTTGMMVPGDEAAVLLRNHVLENAVSRHGRDRQNLYALAESALAAFLKGEKPRRLAPAEEELFPLPGEAGWAQDDFQSAGPRLADAAG